MKITVIGCGWLGLPLLKALVEAGHTVLGTSRSEATLAQVAAAGGQALRLSLPGTLPQALMTDPDVLIITLPPGGRQLGDAASTVYRQRLEALAPLLQGATPPHVMYTSSTGVYGTTPGVVDETTPTAPTTHSGRAVVAAEAWLSNQPVPTTILRLAGLIGPDRHPGRFYGGRSRAIPDADAPVNLIHRNDVVKAIKRLLLNRPNGDEVAIYNVCANAHPTKGDFYAAASTALGLSIAGKVAGGEDGKIISSAKLRALGWQPEWDTLKL